LCIIDRPKRAAGDYLRAYFPLNKFIRTIIPSDVTIEELTSKASPIIE
jgi:hypothetical protein